MYRASKTVKVESLLLIMFGIAVGVIPIFSGKNIGYEVVLTSILIITLGVYTYFRVNRIKVIIHNDRIEYYGESKKNDRTIYFNNIYLVETVNKSGVFLTFIVDKYKEGNRWLIRGTNPPSTEKEMGRDKDIKLDFKKSLCIDSRKVEKSKEIIQIICSKISKTRIGDGTERYINDIKQEVIEEINNTKLNRIIYKIIMSINLIGLLIVLMILEGKSPILTNKYFKVISLLVYFINGVFSLYLRLKFKNVPSYKIIFNIGIILSVLIIIMLIV